MSKSGANYKWTKKYEFGALNLLNGKISHVSKKSTQFIEKIDTLIWTKIEILTLFPWICQACKNVFRSRTSSQIEKKYDLTEKRDASNFTVNVIFFLEKMMLYTFMIYSFFDFSKA